jgi:hypothetical protein
MQTLYNGGDKPVSAVTLIFFNTFDNVDIRCQRPAALT